MRTAVRCANSIHKGIELFTGGFGPDKGAGNLDLFVPFKDKDLFSDNLGFLIGDDLFQERGDPVLVLVTPPCAGALISKGELQTWVKVGLRLNRIANRLRRESCLLSKI